MSDEADDGVIDQIEENSNKKITYFVVDGSQAMFLDDPNGKPYGSDCSFVRAMKAIYSFCVKLCVTEEAIRHFVGVLVINTTFTETDPEVAMGAENMKHLFPIGVLDKTKVVILEEFITGTTLENDFLEKFGGHTKCNYQKVASYSKLNISYSSGSSRRFTSWILFTNQTNPFGKNFMADGEYHRMLKNLHDIEGRRQEQMDVVRRPLRGKCTIFVLGDSENTEESDLAMWRTVDEEVDVYKEDFETLVFRKTGAVRAHSIVPFSLGPGVEFNVAVYSLVVPKVKQIASSVHAETGLPIKSVATYNIASEAMNGGGPEEAERNVGNKTEFLPPIGVPLQRHQLSNLRKVGGETVVISQGERDIHFRYPKGLRLIEFCPISKLDLWEHVRSPLMLQPHEGTHGGSGTFYAHLFDRLKKRELAAICEYSGRANQKPRHVAIVPNADQNPEEGLHEGLLIVELHDVDDKLDIEAAFDEKLRPPESEETWPTADIKIVEAAKNLSSSLLKKRFTPTAYPNPHLQAFYTMLKCEANLTIDAPDNSNDEWQETMVEKWDKIKPWFDDKSIPLTRRNKAELAGRSFESYAEASSPVIKKEPLKKKAKKENEDIDLEKLADAGKLSSLTVALLKEYAVANSIEVQSAKKKNDLIEAISKHYQK